MKSPYRCALAAIALLCSSGLASAETGTPLRISDDLVLTGAQEYLIWRQVGSRNAPQRGAPLQFEASIYAVVPDSVALHALPAEVTGQIPIVKPYRYARLGNLLLIVNPTDRKIVDIITP
jgi:uncharacterized protein DUF1236